MRVCPNPTIVRGDTAVLEFQTGFDTDLVTSADLTLVQEGETILAKGVDDLCTVDGQSVRYTLTTDESLRLAPGLMRVQLSLGFSTGSQINSYVETWMVSDNLREGSRCPSG